MKFLQRLGKAIMFPVAALPLCGILMGIGYLLCPASMQGGDVSGALPVIVSGVAAILVSALLLAVWPIEFGWLIIENGYDITAILQGLGGKDNITAPDNCATRLRVEVKDREKVNDAVLKKAGARGVMRPGKGSVQVIIGTKVQQVAEALRPLVK